MGREQAAGRESGQGLAYVLVISTVLLIMLVALVDVIMKEMNWVVSTAKKDALLHAGDAGVDRAIYGLQIGNNWEAIPDGTITGYNQDVVYNDVPGIKYTLLVQEGNWTPGMQTGSADSERTVTVFATNTVTGERKKVQAVVQVSTLNSALFSGGNVSLKGNVDIHWGPVVSYSTASDSIIPNNLNFPIYLSKGGIQGGLPDCTSPKAGQCANSYASDSELGPPPEIPINYFRSIAKAQGGNHYQGGAGCYTPDPTFVPPTDDNSVCFIDSCNGLDYEYPNGLCGGKACNPAANGVELKIAGKYCGSGILVVMGDLNATGTSCAIQVDMIPPSQCVPIYEMDNAKGNSNCDPNNFKGPNDLFWNGFLYIAGKISAVGGKRVYGSIYAMEAAKGGGTFEIWYKNANNQLGYLGKSIFVRLWMERAPAAGDVFPE